jgi:methionyl-tRNA formyltransferase
MKIVFFGSPSAALPSFRSLLDAGHAVGLVVTQPDKPAGRGRKLAPSPVKAFALGRGIPVIEPARIRTDETALESIRAAGPDVSVVVAYGQIIPRAVHFFPRHHSINVHFSLLPRYRGAAPVQWTVLNGDAESGVTIIELNDRMDEGDITPIQQDDSLATLAPKIRKEDGRVSWTDPAETIDLKVLALADRPGVYSHFGRKRVGLIRGRVTVARTASPGTVLEVGRAGLAIACGGGTAYLVEELQPEGKGVMSAHAFSLGTRIAPGDSLG